MKKFLAILAGIAAGTIVIFLVERVGHSVYPPPDNIATMDIESIKAYIETSPIGALLFVALSQALGSFAAGIATTLAFKGKAKNLSIISGSVLMFFGFLNLFFIPHPAWFWVASLSVYIPFAILGNKLFSKNVGLNP